jgi:hypothetical protein
MRQIKFRGYNRKREMWLNGSYILNRGHHFIAPDEFAEGKIWEDYEVEEGSIGQLTGVCDCDMEPIYEGDLLISLMLGETFEVVYEAPRFCVKNEDFGTLFINDTKQWKVVGNVHDSIEEEGGEE